MINKEVLREAMIQKLRENQSEAKTTDEQYQEYLTTHIQGVMDAYHQYLRDVLHEEGHDLYEIENTLAKHDEAKYSEEEWVPYRDYFYEPNHELKKPEYFEIAWKHHQNHSPHHWQYWVLINDSDEPKMKALDMPLKHIIEMICDWQSAGKHYGNTAPQWYDEQGDRMILSDKTRGLVEKYLQYLR